MHGIVPIALAPNAKGRRNRALGSESSRWSPALRQFFRPCVLSVLALAAVVGGWGYGAKLSQYLHHSELSKPSATRMWVEHREDSFDVRAHQLSSPHKLLTPQFFALTPLELPDFSRELVFAAPLQSRILTFVSPLHPLRAPPSFHSSLA